MGAAEYVQLKTMCGCVEITFDQSQAPWPTLLKKLECKAFGTLAPVMHGTETYTVPQVLQAFDSGVKIWLGEVLYTRETWNPFENYMNIFKEVKNDADAIKNRLEALDNPTPEQEDELKKAGFDRTVAKLMLNGSIGRMNMKIDRKQHVITKDPDDVVRAVFNPDHYRGFDCSDIRCGETELYKMKFSEGQYNDHVSKFDVAPYLSGMIMGYSKMLMVENFKEIVHLGGKPLYSDTDSIAFVMSEAQYPQYKAKFVPPKKTFEVMEIEGIYERLITVGPKKYAVLAHAKDDSKKRLGIHKGARRCCASQSGGRSPCKQTVVSKGVLGKTSM